MSDLAPLSVDEITLDALPSGVQRVRVSDRSSWLVLRGSDVTASVIGAVFGEHEYTSTLDLWNEKRGAGDRPVDETPAMRRGRLLEPVAFQILAEERPDWRVFPLSDQFYYRDKSRRIGCTPDGFAVDPARPGFGIVQVKTTDSLVFRRKWAPEVPGEPLNVPTWIGLQALTEMRLTGASWGVVVLLVAGHGLDIHVVDVPEPPGLWEVVSSRVADFWRLVETGTMPDLDFGHDARRIVDHYAVKDGTTVDLSADNRFAELVSQREALRAIEKAGADAEKSRKVADAEIIAKMGHASHATFSGGGRVSVSTITVNRKPSPASTYSYPKIGVSGVVPLSAASPVSRQTFPEKF